MSSSLSYTSLYNAEARANCSKSPSIDSLVIAPGSRVTRIGIGGCPVPCATPLACELPITPSGTAASSLLIAAAQLVGLSKRELESYSLVVVAPPTSFGRVERRSLSDAALSILQMKRVLFVEFHIAVSLSARIDNSPHIIVDVGWESTRVIIRGLVVAVALTGLRSVNSNLLSGMKQIEDRAISAVDPLPKEDEQRACVLRGAACFFSFETPNMAERTPSQKAGVGPLLGSDEFVLIPASLRSSAPEALFNADDPDKNVAAAVLRSLLREQDLDTRSHMAQTIVCVGGGAGIPGFQQRLEEELSKELAVSPGFKNLAGAVATVPTAPFSADILPWVGGSLAGSVDSLWKDSRCCSTPSLDSSEGPKLFAT